ncbi:thioredoxin family protein [Coprinopsis marcescibilis]|uniref:Thioredoxin family protein n=1 Tax=Coprinopsis marcescibilis TaxID=230819 RepID=A0A5C3KVX9_COPMA|nr:thioredoxin family protein [Coprinopsis marcescibilis]
MTTPVKLYVYDLSNGMARQLSRQLTGRQIDGIWHTSVVVFNNEIFYGQGISITQPGKSHHGTPMQILDMGETAIDEATFTAWLSELRNHYTADKYHLLEFNCNSFTNDCVGFLTGASIPDFIKDLPTDFLSTPFGQSLRPTIDAMYRRPTANAAPVPAPSAPGQPPQAVDQQTAAAIIQAVQAMAASRGNMPNGGASVTPQQPNPIAGPIHIITNNPSFQSFLRTHKAAVAFFTSQTCPPCRMIEPVFESLAEERGFRSDRDGAGFAKIDLGVGTANQVAGQYGVRATPTFIFFLNGQKVDELKGADAAELRSQINLLLFQAYPPHPHTKLSLPSIQALSLNPILFTQVPAIDTVLTKLSGFIDSASWPTSVTQSQSEVKRVLVSSVSTYLKGRFAPPVGAAKANLPSATATLLQSWSHVTKTLVTALPIECLFPLVDMWRVALQDPAVGVWLAAFPAQDPINIFFPNAISAVQQPSKQSRNYVLTVLRLLSNGFSSPVSAKWLLTGAVRERLTQVVVPSLLHEDAAIRTAAASLAFNCAAYFQKARTEAVRTGKRWSAESEGEDMGDWQVEIASAVVEAIDRERENEEVVHRLAASLAFLIRLSPVHDVQLVPLLEVLQAKQVLKSKLAKGTGWTADGGIAKQDIRKLVGEISDKLCP